MRYPQPLNKRTQAGRIINKLGGVNALWKELQVFETPRRVIPSHPTIMYRWTYPVSRGGTGGLIPSGVVPFVKAAACLMGVTLTPEDWYPDTAEEIEEGQGQ